MSRIVMAAALIVLTSACGSKTSPATAPASTELTAAEVTASRPLHGVFRMSSDGAWFEECARRVPAMHVAHRGLAYAYLDDYFRAPGTVDPQRGAIITVLAHVEDRKGSGHELVIDQMDRVASGAHMTCSTLF